MQYRWPDDLLHLLFPHQCEGCATDLLAPGEPLCTHCARALPATFFFGSTGNPVERMFYGRIDIACAASAYYFTKHSVLQQLLVRLKYRGDRAAGIFLGARTGRFLADAPRFAGTGIVVPLPLNPVKERQRGYNQAAVICNGISRVWDKPVIHNAVIRTRFTETQTHRNRVSRWQNMEGVFAVPDKSTVSNSHILLVDDVITTGATLEACTAVLMEAGAASVRLVTVAYTV